MSPTPEKRPAEKHSVFLESDVPLDLILALAWLGAAIASIYMPVLNQTPLRYVLTIPLVFFVPGYCLVAALFPKGGEIGLIERLMLSVGVSIAVVPLIGLGLNFTPLGIRLEPLVGGVALFSIGMIFLTHYRRALLPDTERFRVRFFSLAGRAGTGVIAADEGRIDHVLNIILIGLICIALAGTIYVIVSPKQGEKFSEFYILNENRTADNYPIDVTPGESYPMYIGVGNQEFRNVSYTIETWVQQVEFNKLTNTSRIIVMNSGEKRVVTLAHNESILVPYNLSVPELGYDRVDFLLFNETVPGPDVTGNERVNASYREVHLWITDY